MEKFAISQFYLEYVVDIKSQDDTDNKVTGQLYFDSRNARRIFAHNSVQTSLWNHRANFEMGLHFGSGFTAAEAWR
jgi:hypothetical protein